MDFLSKLLGKKDTPCVAVIDVETTGLNPYRNHRIVEIAALVMQPNGEVLRRFVSLVNPERDIGPSRIHGLSSRDVLAAPRFGEIAGSLLETLNGCVALAGHNIRFDYSFLSAEFERLGYQFPNIPMLCPMQMAGGGSLSYVCADYGIPFEGVAHSAWYDARATAQLLTALLNETPPVASRISRSSPITWPKVPKTGVTPFTREDSHQRQNEPPDYLQQLIKRVQRIPPTDIQNSTLLEYTALLDRALENRHISVEEGEDLVEFATQWGIPSDQILNIHRDYLLRLATAALTDAVLTDSERRDLYMVASLLGIDSLDDIVEMATQKLTVVHSEPVALSGSLTLKELSGKRVCFTGESQCKVRGTVITREMAEEIATMNGMSVAQSVTKKVDMLVVADPLTQSGKAIMARRYGIRIIHETMFWKVLGLHVE